MELLTDLKKKIDEEKLTKCYVLIPHADILRVKSFIRDKEEYIQINKRDIELALEYEACWILFIASEHLEKGEYEVLIP